MPYKTMNAERRAEQTLVRFSRWLDKNGGRRFFSWVHFYDPHWPYDPPSPFKERFPGRPYDGEIAYMDDQVGALLDGLRERGLLERTIVVVAGDHGEGLGEKVEMGHGIFLYEEPSGFPITEQPRPSRGPGSSRARSGWSTPPTILDILGLGDRAAAMKGGASFPGSRKGGRTWMPWRPSIPGRTSAGRSWSGSSPGLEVRSVSRPEMYDLEADPEEL
jgi:arylsulfatase A-like enzyme